MNIEMVFAMIFTIVVIAMVFAFGFDQIMAIFNIGGQAQCQSIIEKLDREVQNVYSYAVGSGVPVELNPPENCKICFVNTSDPSKRLYTAPEKNWKPDPVYISMILENGYNIWWEYGSSRSGYVIDHLAVEKSFCALPNQEIYFESKGLYVGVS